ncbi:hypothetical protein MBLNU459_g7245t1 [Dothideomycetes sp. NU459]
MSDSSSTAAPGGVHLVGSIPVATAEQVFTKCAKVLAGRLRRIPDGEPGHRNQFIWFQRERFEKHAPGIVIDFSKWGVGDADIELSEAEAQKVIDATPEFDTGYDEGAIESYPIFKRLRDEGVISPHTRFQVTLPTPINFVGGHTKPAYRKALEPFYERALLRASSNIQAAIPLKDLAIQWDVAVDVALMEGVPFLTPWFAPVFDGVVERIVRLANTVPVEVELGFHLCYGDVDHKHFVEPKDLGLLTRLMIAIVDGVKRPITWFHVPVPKDRDDEAYFAPLADPAFTSVRGDIELYLGLVHAWDLEGTKKRIATAKKVVDSFGVANECGMGRTPPTDVDSNLEIAAAVSSPVV